MERITLEPREVAEGERIEAIRATRSEAVRKTVRTFVPRGVFR